MRGRAPHDALAAVVAVSVLLALMTAGCTSSTSDAGGGGSTTSVAARTSSATSPVTPTTSTTSALSAAAAHAGDVAYAQMMMLHAEQGLDLGDFALRGHGASAGVRRIAEQAETSDTATVTTLQGWLTRWHAPTMPPTEVMRVPGTVTEAGLHELAGLHGAAFDARWTQLMLTRGRAAVSMGQQVLRTTQAPEVRDLATRLDAQEQQRISRLTTFAR